MYLVGRLGTYEKKVYVHVVGSIGDLHVHMKKLIEYERVTPWHCRSRLSGVFLGCAAVIFLFGIIFVIDEFPSLSSRLSVVLDVSHK